MVFNYTLLEIIGSIFTILAFILIFMSSIKLFRSHHIPGTKLIFYSIIFTLVGTVISLGYMLLAEGEENYILEAAISLLVGIAFFIGSYGFWNLSKFIVNANKSFNTSSPDLRPKNQASGRAAS